MSEKDLLYQYLTREVQTFISSNFPAASFFSGTIVNYIINAIDPYVNLFVMGGDLPTHELGKINVKAAGDFVKSELNDKISKFVENYENK